MIDPLARIEAELVAQKRLKEATRTLPERVNRVREVIERFRPQLEAVGGDPDGLLSQQQSDLEGMQGAIVDIRQKERQLRITRSRPRWFQQYAALTAATARPAKVLSQEDFLGTRTAHNDGN